jgi:hypothetical protein
MRDAWLLTSDMAARPETLAIDGLLPSCCGRWHAPRGLEAVEVTI